MRNLLIQRLAAGVVGLLLGLVLALIVVDELGDLDAWWLFVAVPLACMVLAMLLGPMFVEYLRESLFHA